ncbi:MAG: substrate-binding domain-containing protein, partial [Mycobacterium sp.]|nr:substrate-binding domain-containing protein [Mycobacterium sp.]
MHVAARRFGGVVVAGVVVATVFVAGYPAQAAPTQLIQGSGSSAAANAVSQWIADGMSQGLFVVYSASGSAQGRRDFAARTVDFAVTDVPYQGTDPATGQSDDSAGRAYAYLPLVAGGVAFPYHLSVNGHQVTDLRLSGATLAGIFTNRIRNWDDPAITADNNGHQLPNLPIIPVVHSEGSGDSYQFTSFLATEFAGQWQAFSGSSARTEYFPASGDQVAETGSDAVANFIGSTAANGAIGYDEYSYALGRSLPVAKIGNAAGYYTAPTAGNVAVSLTKAVINQDSSSPDYLTADFSQVYGFTDRRTYPLSFYSYMIIPTASDDQMMTTAKRQTLVDYLDIALCAGQWQTGPIGYAPLPLNLVESGFAQLQQLKTADPNIDMSGIDLAHCNNPNFTGNPPHDSFGQYPMPPACDSVGHGPCSVAPDLTGLSSPASTTIGYGHSVRLSTTLRDTSNHTTLAGYPLTVSARPAGASQFRKIATIKTGSDGVGRLSVAPTRTTAYHFSYARTLEHAATTSRATTVRVGQSVPIHTRTTITLGHRARMWGLITPRHAGGLVRLQKRANGKWLVIATTRQHRQVMPDGKTQLGYRFTYHPA